MNFENPLPLLDQIDLGIDQLRGQLGLGPTIKVPESDGLLVPLVAGSNRYPVLVALVTKERSVRLEARWVEAMPCAGHVEKLRLTKIQPAAVLLSLFALEANSRARLSAACYDENSGEIFVRDLLYPVNGVLIGLRERIVAVVLHARDIIKSAAKIWSYGFDLPMRPDWELDE